MLFLRAMGAFLALPTVVAGVAPWLLLRSSNWLTLSYPGAGWPLLALGLLVLLICVVEFYRFGKGTLAPWNPPKKLVTAGLYRFARNPMYIGVIAIVAGWSLAAGSPLLGCYAALLAVGFHLRVVLYEEPALARAFPADWALYSKAVNRWLPATRGLRSSSLKPSDTCQAPPA